MKKSWEIEGIIEDIIAELSEEYELDRWDIEDIRLQAYRDNGWDHDPFAEGEEEEEEEEEETFHYMSFEDHLRDLGMSYRDFI